MKLKKKQWKTDDTCPGCSHQGMEFTADMEDDDRRQWRAYGVLSCPDCGWFDDMVFVYDYQVPDDCIERE